MSKSDDNANAWVALLDDRDTIIRNLSVLLPIRSEIRMSDDKPGRFKSYNDIFRSYG